MASGIPLMASFKKRKQEPLCFGKDGKFRILHLTDIHAVMPEMDDEDDRRIPEDKDRETQNVIKECVRIANPDLVVFGGDNVSGYWEEFNYDLIKKTIDKIVSPIAEKNIPLAIVFGNHDSELGFHREIQMCFYNDYPNFRSSMNAEEMYGCGNCNLVIKSSDMTKNAYNIWLIDSNDYVRDEDGNQLRGYGYVHESQLSWYNRTAAKLREENGGKPVPALLFQHIPVEQEYDFLKEVPVGTEDSVKRGDKAYAKAIEFEGRLREAPCPPKDNHREQFDGWVENGDVVAAFFGHDHVNDFIMEKDGIKLIQTIGAGYCTYGNERGGRLIVLDENNPRDIFTQTIEIPRITDTDFSRK